MSKTKSYELHPLVEMFPPMGTSELADLATDITEHGLREPIVLLDGKVIDGRNRLSACQMAKIKPVFRTLSKSEAKDPLSVVRSLNLERRHLDASQRSVIAAELADLAQGKRKDNGKGTSQKDAAKAANVSVASLKLAKTVKAKGHKEIQKAVKAGQLKISAAARLAKLPAAKQRKIAGGGVSSMKKAARGGLAAEAAEAKAKVRAAVSGGLKGKVLAALDEYWSEAKRTISTETPASIFDGCRATVEIMMD